MKTRWHHCGGVALTVGFVLVVCSGCQTTAQRWERAQSENTAQAYRDFIRSTNWQLPVVADAQRRLEMLDYQEARRINTIKSYRAYLEAHSAGKAGRPIGGDGKNAQVARAALQVLAREKMRDLAHIQVQVIEPPIITSDSSGKLQVRSLSVEGRRQRDAVRQAIEAVVREAGYSPDSGTDSAKLVVDYSLLYTSAGSYMGHHFRMWLNDKDDGVLVERTFMPSSPDTGGISFERLLSYARTYAQSFMADINQQKGPTTPPTVQ